MDVSKIKIPGYSEAINIKDEKARNDLNNLTTDVENKINAINSISKDNISPLSALIMSFELSSNPPHNRLFYTDDCRNFRPIMELEHVYGRNSVMTFHNGHIIKADYWDNSSTGGTIQFMTTKNFVEWKKQIITISSIKNNQWTNPGNFFEYNGKHYYCFFVSDTTKPIKNKLGWGFSTYIAEINIDNPENITVKNVVQKDPSNMPIIDPFIYRDNNRFYMLYKDDSSDNAGDGNTHLYYRTMDDSFNFTGAQTEINCFKVNGVNVVEAPSMFINENYLDNGYYKYYLFADNFTQDFSVHPGGGMVVACGNDINNLTNMGLINTTNVPMRAGGIFPLKNNANVLNIINQFVPYNQTESIIYSNVTDMYTKETLHLKRDSGNTYLINDNLKVRAIDGLENGKYAYLVLPQTNNMLLYPKDNSMILPHHMQSLFIGNTNSEKLIRVQNNFGVYYFDLDLQKNINHVFTDMNPLFIAVSGDIGNLYFLKMFYNNNINEAYETTFGIHNGTVYSHDIYVPEENKLNIEYVRREETSHDIIKITPTIQYTKISIESMSNVALLQIPDPR